MSGVFCCWLFGEDVPLIDMLIKILHSLFGGLKTQKSMRDIYQYLPCELVCQICEDVPLYVPLEHHKREVDYNYFFRPPRRC